MSGRLDKPAIENKFLQLDNELLKYGIKLKILVFGGANIILQHNPSWRDKTFDIDVLLFGKVPHGFEKLVEKLEFHIQSDIFFYTHPDWEDRLEVIREFRNLTVISPNVHDLAISKIARGFERDIKDIIESEMSQKINIDKLEVMYREAMGYWIGRPEEYEWNWKNFKNVYEQQKQSYDNNMRR